MSATTPTEATDALAPAQLPHVSQPSSGNAAVAPDAGISCLIAHSSIVSPHEALGVPRDEVRVGNRVRERAVVASSSR